MNATLPPSNAQVGYREDLEINSRSAEMFPSNCAVIERTGDGVSVGKCWFHLKDGITCPRHGKVKSKPAPEDGR